MAWDFDSVTDLYRRMEEKASTGFRVSAETAGVVITALRHYAREAFVETARGYQIEVWDVTGSRPVINFAQVADLGIAQEAFEHAARMYPRVLVTMRQGVRVIKRSHEEDAIRPAPRPSEDDV